MNGKGGLVIACRAEHLPCGEIGVHILKHMLSLLLHFKSDDVKLGLVHSVLNGNYLGLYVKICLVGNIVKSVLGSVVEILCSLEVLVIDIQIFKGFSNVSRLCRRGGILAGTVVFSLCKYLCLRFQIV